MRRVNVGKGKVTISFGISDRIWLNGARVENRPGKTVNIKVGDTVVYATGFQFWCRKPASARTFEFDRLDFLKGKVAWFTERTYSVRAVSSGQEGTQIFPDQLLSTRTRRVADREADDGGPGEFPGVELRPSDSPTSSKESKTSKSMISSTVSLKSKTFDHMAAYLY